MIDSPFGPRFTVLTLRMCSVRALHESGHWMNGQRMLRRNQPAITLRSCCSGRAFGGCQGFGQFSIATRTWPIPTV